MKHIFLLVAVLLFGCISDDEFAPDFTQESVNGFKPIYAEPQSLKLGLESARNISLAGKIYSYGNLLLVNEVGSGIHVYDNVDPKNPVNKYFVSIPGNNDMAMKAGVLYADSYNDLLTLEVSKDTVILLKRLEDVMGLLAGAPSFSGVYFECVDESKGVVVGWEEAELNKPKCYKP